MTYARVSWLRHLKSGLETESMHDCIHTYIHVSDLGFGHVRYFGSKLEFMHQYIHAYIHTCFSGT